jgi:hypothetical protein
MEATWPSEVLASYLTHGISPEDIDLNLRRLENLKSRIRVRDYEI